jgi:hypothetical protein
VRIVELGIFVEIINLPLHAVGVRYPKFILSGIATVGARLFFGYQIFDLSLPQLEVEFFFSLYLKTQVTEILLNPLFVLHKGDDERRVIEDKFGVVFFDFYRFCLKKGGVEINGGFDVADV